MVNYLYECEVFFMRMYDIIRHKRMGQALTEQEIRHMIAGYTAGDIPDYQMSALAMAVFTHFAEKKKMAWLDNFSIAGSMLVGMAAAVICGMIF